MFEDKIVSTSTARQRTLKRAAKVASTSPETQVKIFNKSAYYVIKDCADITLKYLPHFTYSTISYNQLKGKVTEQDIIDFVGRASKDVHTKQLLQIILDDITSKDTISTTSEFQEITDFTIDEGTSDVYGDYDYIDEPSSVDTEPQPVGIVDINNGSEVINKLKEVFLT